MDALEAASKIAQATVEMRVISNKSLIKSTASRLEDVYKSFTDRLSAKDDTVQLVKDIGNSVMKQSAEVQRQLGLRFNFVTGMVGFIALAFAASFTYNVFKPRRLMRRKTF